MKYIHALIEDPKLSFLKTTLLRTNNDGKEMQCTACGKKVNLKDVSQHPITDVFCSETCYINVHKFVPLPTEPIISHQSSYKAINAEKCSECEGERRGKGWSHNEGCSLDTRPKGPKNFCPKCNGPARGRGFIHAQNCLMKIKGKIDA